MPYITLEYYNDTYHGTPIDADEIDRFIGRASDVVDMVTNYKITDFDALHPRIQELIKKATAAQVEFFEVAGGIDEIVAESLNNASIGKFSYGNKASSGNLSRTQAAISPLVIQFLSHTGLLNRSVSVYG
ncbi:hypothetical protein [Paenisporosarcina sp. TG-14]|uniref:hypothetical protein n=1 Tax=Paenisporosarcina sp. TG-14 TaxID=1231057 RepID=UPI0002F07596|nr:hypothetical protein [Paenisporosarcina sp. TG-14]